MISQLPDSGSGLNAPAGSFTLKPRWKERLKNAVRAQEAGVKGWVSVLF